MTFPRPPAVKAKEVVQAVSDDANLVVLSEGTSHATASHQSLTKTRVLVIFHDVAPGPEVPASNCRAARRLMRKEKEMFHFWKKFMSNVCHMRYTLFLIEILEVFGTIRKTMIQYTRDHAT